MGIKVEKASILFLLFFLSGLIIPPPTQPMLAVQWPQWKDKDSSMSSGVAYLDTGNEDDTHDQQSQCMMTKHEKQKAMNEAMDPGLPIQYPSMHVPSNDITTRFPSCNKTLVMTKYREMMHGPIYQAFKRAAAGELYRATDLASVKLPILEKALQQAMKGHVKDQLIDRCKYLSPPLLLRTY